MVTKTGKHVCPECDHVLSYMGEDRYYCVSCDRDYSWDEVEEGGIYRYEKTSGRCFYCGRPVRECECD